MNYISNHEMVQPALTLYVDAVAVISSYYFFFSDPFDLISSLCYISLQVLVIAVLLKIIMRRRFSIIQVCG